jgi:pimeloyl-ACP methyl ester carboxylesterase
VGPPGDLVGALGGRLKGGRITGLLLAVVQRQLSSKVTMFVVMAAVRALVVILGGMSDVKHVVLIHGMGSRANYLAPVRAAFEDRGYTVHSPTLRHHELSLEEGANKIASLSLRDYTDDVVELVDSLDSAALLVGHSMGGLLVQLVAARTRHAGVVAACPAPAAGIYATSPTLLRIGSRHFLQPRPWAKPFYPMTWEQFRKSVANAQTEEYARELYAELVCGSGRYLCEVSFSRLDRGKAATVDFAAITTPVLIIAGECDRLLPARIPRLTAARYQNATYVEISGADHYVFSGEALPITMRYIDDWLAKNHLLTTA